MHECQWIDDDDDDDDDDGERIYFNEA